MMKKAFLRQSDTFSGRPTLYGKHELREQLDYRRFIPVHESCWGRGHVISDGESNIEMRRFIMTILRRNRILLFHILCFISENAVNRLDRLIADETKNMIESIDRKIAIADNNKCIINIEDTVLFVVGNVLTQLVLGRSYPHDSDEFRYYSTFTFTCL
jgi:hypothetical protein